MIELNMCVHIHTYAIRPASECVLLWQHIVRHYTSVIWRVVFASFFVPHQPNPKSGLVLFFLLGHLLEKDVCVSLFSPGSMWCGIIGYKKLLSSTTVVCFHVHFSLGFVTLSFPLASLLLTSCLHHFPCLAIDFTWNLQSHAM